MSTLTERPSPAQLPQAVREDWERLAAPTPRPARFDPVMVAHLPDPARRWLAHAIAPATPLLRCVELDMHGEIRLGSWRRFAAREVLAPLDGFVWSVTAHLAGLPLRGYDRHTRGTGQMRHSLFGVPVLSAAGPDLTRSAAGRLTSEIAFVPGVGAAPEVAWRAVDDRDAVALLRCGGRIHEVTLTVAPSGALERVTIPRWGRLGRGPYLEHLFAAAFQEESTFDGYTIPTRMTAGWEGHVSIRQTVDRAVFH